MKVMARTAYPGKIIPTDCSGSAGEGVVMLRVAEMAEQEKFIFLYILVFYSCTVVQVPVMLHVVRLSS